MPGEILLVFGQHVEHLVNTLRVEDELGGGAVGGGMWGGARFGGGFSGGGRVIGVGGESGVDLGDEVWVAGYEVSAEGVCEGGEHAAGGHDFVVDLGGIVSIAVTQR